MVKFIADRKEFGKAINFGEYPVLAIDCTKENGDKLIHGFLDNRMRVDFGYFNSGNRWIEKCYMNIYSETSVDDPTPRAYISSGCHVMSASFTFNDAMEQVSYANTPFVKPNGKMMIFMFNTKSNRFSLMEVGFGNIHKHCSQAIDWEDDEDAVTIARQAYAVHNSAKIKG